MGLLNQRAIQAAPSANKSNVVTDAKNYYKENKRLIDGLAWAAVLVGVMRVTANHLQKK